MGSVIYSSSLWDSSHDWILKFDNILNGNAKNNFSRKGSFDF